MKLSATLSSFYCVLFFNVLLHSVNANVCTGQPNGTKFPVENDCNRFILCDSGASMTLACRSSEPHYDRCTGKCINNIAICQQTSCTSSTTTTTTKASTQPSTQPSTQAPVTTTTRFVPPTVPVACPAPCVGSDTSCPGGCKEQWTCMNGKCACDSKKLCPFEQAKCEENCGCTENCEATAADPSLYLCKPTLAQCPFNDENGACVKNCGCIANCKCTPGTPPTACTCENPCKCNGPPDVCPFERSQCVSKCDCEERCLCRGTTCTCDGNNACPKSLFSLLNY